MITLNVIFSICLFIYVLIRFLTLLFILAGMNKLCLFTFVLTRRSFNILPLRIWGMTWAIAAKKQGLKEPP